MRTLFIAVMVALSALAVVGAEKKTSKPKAPTVLKQSGKIRHRFFKTGWNSQSIAIVDKNDKIEWEMPMGTCMDAWLLLCRTSEFYALTTPKQTRVLDRTVSSLATKAMDSGARIPPQQEIIKTSLIGHLWPPRG